MFEPRRFDCEKFFFWVLAISMVEVFQYSSSASVEEVSKESYDNCTTSNALQTYSNGNTSVPLARPGAWYFIPGNRMYCLGGMRLQVNVVGSPAASPAGTPQAVPGPGAPTRPGTKSDTPSTSSSNGLVHARSYKIVSALIGPVAAVLWVAHV